MITLRSYAAGRWMEGTGDLATLVNPATEEALARGGTGGIDMAAVLGHARTVGGPALRGLTFAERGALLRAATDALQAHRNELLDLAVANGGNTRGDAKFDVDGAIFTLAAYADIGKALGTTRVLVDGEGVTLGRSPRFHGQHIQVTRTGVAIHINAFNFPAWGMAEKAATALLAGMPVVSKPATSSAMVAHRMMEILLEAKALPEGALAGLACEREGLVEEVLERLAVQVPLAQPLVALAELLIGLELELGLKGVDQLYVALEVLELLRLADAERAVQN